MSTFFSSKNIRESLQVHKWLGLWLCALIYLVCISGSLVVFFEEFDRLEQSNISEYSHFKSEYIQPALDEYTQRIGNTPESIYIVLPTEDFPRTHITDGIDEWYLGEDGAFEAQPDVPWTSMLKDLHTHLHLPHTLGMAIVGICGIFILALTISGIVAHPTIIRDAFTLRLGRTKIQSQSDLHNRLGVWGLPFNIMISVTGAFIGLGAILIALGSALYFENDQDSMLNAVYGEDPAIESNGENFDYPAAFANLAQYHPQAQPIYVVIHRMGNDDQLMEIAATLPERLIYSEIYRFDTSGNIVNHQGLSDGPAGRQVAYSTYRLHFGHFGNFWVKVIYFVMGLALTYVCISGTNLWLAKRKHKDAINGLWFSWLWAVPLALASALLLKIWFENLIAVFWISALIWTFVLFLMQMLKEKKAAQ